MGQVVYYDYFLFPTLFFLKLTIAWLFPICFIFCVSTNVFPDCPKKKKIHYLCCCITLV